jgi:hypothetical protein
MQNPCYQRACYQRSRASRFSRNIPVTGRADMFRLHPQRVLLPTIPCGMVRSLLPMRRLLAHVALAALCLGFLSPFLPVAQLPTAHSCCLRTGKHQCQESAGSTTGHGFRAARGTCPYSVPITVASFQGLHATKFEIDSPWATGVVAQNALERGHRTAGRKWSARGPPALLL